MKMKKLLSLALAAVLAGSALAGCGTGGTTSSTPEGTSSGSKDPEKKQTLKVAALESAYGADVWKEIEKAFEEVKGNVDIELTIDKSLETIINPKMKAGDYPDFVHLAKGRKDALTETMIKENALTAIDDVFDMTVPGESKKVSEKLLPGFRDASGIKPYSDGKTYLAPMFYSPAGLYYNAGLLEAKGWSVPKTWDEMWELGEKAKAEGIALFTYPTAGYFDAFSFALLANIGGEEFMNKVLRYEEGIWDTDEAKTYLEIMGKMAEYTEASTVGNANNQNYLKNQQLILENKAIFMPNGTWVVGEMEDAPRAEGFKWGQAALPVSKAGNQQYILTFFEQCWIPEGAENKDLAKEFMAFMYSDKAAEIFSKANAAQPIEGAPELFEDGTIEKTFYEIYATDVNAVTANFADTEPVPGVSIGESWFTAYDGVVSGAKSLDQWKADIVAASDALRAALK